MKIFGLEITRTKALNPLDSMNRWTPLIQEPYTGAWQRNDEIRAGSVLDYFAVYSVITLIANDIGKLKPLLMVQDASGIWSETSSGAFSPVLNRPNRYQNHVQFLEWWIMSKLIHGNTYALKGRDLRGVVTSLVLLDPTRVRPLVADDGSVYYELNTDILNGLPDLVSVPAGEIIHDRMNCLYHPLVGVSPLWASALPAGAGQRMLKDSASFFSGGAKPSGIITVPGKITQETASAMREAWNANNSGEKASQTAILSEGMQFTPIRMSAVDSQLVEQMKWSAEMVCSTFHVPAFKIGASAIPPGQSVEAMNQIYYSDCLQSLIEQLELCLAEGLALPDYYDVTLNLEGLLRMDTATQYKTLGEGIHNAVLAPNEARAKLNLKPLEGGDSVYMQQQNFSLEALAKRDAEDPFAAPPPAPMPQQEPDNTAEEVKRMLETIRKELSHV